MYYLEILPIAFPGAVILAPLYLTKWSPIYWNEDNLKECSLKQVNNYVNMVQRPRESEMRVDVIYGGANEERRVWKEATRRFNAMSNSLDIGPGCHIFGTRASGGVYIYRNMTPLCNRSVIGSHVKSTTSHCSLKAWGQLTQPRNWKKGCYTRSITSPGERPCPVCHVFDKEIHFVTSSINGNPRATLYEIELI